MGAMGHFLTFVGFVIAGLIVATLKAKTEDRRSGRDQ